MIIQLAICAALLLGSSMEITNIKATESRIVINGVEITCQVCGKEPSSVQVINGEVKAYCDKHMPKEEDLKKKINRKLLKNYKKYGRKS